jgi:outer membrane protein OmpA-like peptidoglycan-associated protein
MTAATFDTNTVQGAPRRLVDDAWVALNRRYAIGTGVLLTALALLWGIGSGPGALRTAEPAATAVPRPATGTSPAATSSGSAGFTPSGSPTGASSGPAASPGGGSPAPAGSASSGASPSAAARAGSNGGAGAAAAGGASASGTGPSAAGTGPSAAGSGAASSDAALPRALPGAPVGRLYFEPDQAWPSGEVGPALAPVLARLKAEPDTRALVSGFHDRRGSPERNAALAQRRAQTVRRVLIREGIAANRIVLAKPQQTQGSGGNREARRVEVTVAR